MIAEDRTLRTKYYEAKVQAHFLISSPAYLTATPVNIGNNSNAFVDYSDRDLTITHTKDSSGGQTGFFFLRSVKISFFGSKNKNKLFRWNTKHVLTRADSFMMTRHSDASYIQETSYNLTLPTSEGFIKIPRLGESLTLQGRDTKILVVDYAVGDYNLLYSSAEVMTS
jgi:beta-galactosidase